MRPIHNILVPTDFSATANDALREALELAQPLGARVTLFHTLELPNAILPDGSALVTTASDYAALVDATERALHALELDAATFRVPIATMTATGDPRHEIVRAAEEGRYDLIVMGTHGRTGLRRLVLGSIAESVVRHAKVPVLTVHPQATQRAEQPST